jgi:hypothetical protein
MAYEKKSVRSVISDINSRKIYLPAIQRKYVWDDDQITRLMDSIMLGYPIGTFLFWKVKKTVINKKEYSMYEFIKDFTSAICIRILQLHNLFPIGSDEEAIWAVLDGQQRLTSMYIALQGSVSRKSPISMEKQTIAFPQKELFFNLHSRGISEDDIFYEFRFMSSDEAKNKKKMNCGIW